jgi:hypothetical protein
MKHKIVKLFTYNVRLTILKFHRYSMKLIIVKFSQMNII